MIIIPNSIVGFKELLVLLPAKMDCHFGLANGWLKATYATNRFFRLTLVANPLNLHFATVSGKLGTRISQEWMSIHMSSNRCIFSLSQHQHLWLSWCRCDLWKSYTHGKRTSVDTKKWVIFKRKGKHLPTIYFQVICLLVFRGSTLKFLDHYWKKVSKYARNDPRVTKWDPFWVGIKLDAKMYECSIFRALFGFATCPLQC